MYIIQTNHCNHMNTLSGIGWVRAFMVDIHVQVDMYGGSWLHYLG
jgi:hypothetical protein